jgi:uncharacterized membrane protein
MKHFSKITFVDGVMFLVPIALALWVLNYAFQLTEKVSRPIAKTLHLDQLGEWSGIWAATIIAVLALIFVAYAAGLFAETNAGKGITGYLEKSLLGSFPHYQLMKGMAEALAHIESTSHVKPVLVSVDDDAWQIGYSLETVQPGWVAVFIPQAPSPMSGNVMYFKSDRLRPLSISMVQAMELVKRMGLGSSEILRSVDLSAPGKV